MFGLDFPRSFTFPAVSSTAATSLFTMHTTFRVRLERIWTAGKRNLQRRLLGTEIRFALYGAAQHIV